MQTVENKTTVLILVFKEFLPTSIPPLISVLYAKGYHCFPSKNFRFTVPKNFAEEPVCFRKFRSSKNFMPKRGISRFSIENLLSHSTEKLRRGTLLCFTKFLVPKKFMDKRGGVSQFSVNIFLSHSAEKFRRGTPQCVTNFGYWTILCFWELCHDFVWKFFCLTVPKNFVEELFWSVFQKMSGSENVYGWDGGDIKISVEKFVSQWRKNS